MKQNSSRESNVPRLRDRLRETTSRAILDAAERTLATEGLQAAKMETIAARAGVAVGTVYNYFEDRTALCGALVAARRIEMLEAVDAALEAEGKDWHAQFLAFFQALLNYVEEHRPYFVVLFQGELVQKGGGDVNAPTHPRATIKELYARLEKLLRRGVRAGVLRHEDAAVFAPMLIGMFRGMVMYALHQDVNQPLTDLAKPLVRLFLEGASAR